MSTSLIFWGPSTYRLSMHVRSQCQVQTPVPRRVKKSRDCNSWWWACASPPFVSMSVLLLGPSVSSPGTLRPLCSLSCAPAQVPIKPHLDGIACLYVISTSNWAKETSGEVTTKWACSIRKSCTLPLWFLSWIEKRVPGWRVTGRKTCSGTGLSFISSASRVYKCTHCSNRGNAAMS